jgi:type IV secretion system protein VirD4
MNTTLLRWVFLLLAVAVLGWAMEAAYRASVFTSLGLMSVGWASFLGVANPNPLRFTFFCFINTYCMNAYTQVWLRAYPLYLPLLGLLPLWGVAVLKVISESEKVRTKKSPGGGRWAKPADLRAYIKGEKGSPSRGYLGILPEGKMLRPPERLRCGHTLVIGGTGARKSTGYYKPNMVADAQDGVSGIIIDLKYPDVRGGFFSMVSVYERAGHDVQLFLPYSEHSLRFPLLADGDTPGGAAEIATMVIPVPAKEDSATFYRNEERDLLKGLILGLARQGETSAQRLYRLLEGGTGEVQRYARRHPDQEVRRVLSGFFEQDARTQAGIVKGLKGRLELFNDPRLDEATTASRDAKRNVDLVGVGLRPTLLYIGIPQDRVQGEYGQLLLQLIKRAIDKALIRTANSRGGSLPVQVSFYLDEFANMGVLPNISQNFATMRSRRVAYHVTLQNRGQVEALYGRGSFSGTFTNNFHHTVLYPRFLRFDDAEYFSKALGTITTIEKVTGVARTGWFDETRNEVVREVARPLLSLEEMAEWPEEMGIVMMSGVPPVRVVLPRLDERKALMVRNPFYRAYKSLPEVVDAEEVARRIVECRCAPTPEDVRAAQGRLEELRAKFARMREETPTNTSATGRRSEPQEGTRSSVAVRSAESAPDHVQYQAVGYNTLEPSKG